ncbi:hemagglutinin-neuraminidase [avian paramyxovirus 12]|nr:hemagglutinin-neuraminidase [Avian orthoavulavirus 12]
MENAASQISFANDQESGRRTWRLLFRILVIIITLGGLAVSIASMIYSIGAAVPGDVSSSEAGIKAYISKATQPLVPIDETTQRIYRQVILEAPVTQLNMETNILNAITALSYQIDASANATGCGAPVHDQDFTGGVGRELFSDSEGILTNLRPSKFIEHLNFIPAPTTGNGCTRIPSFDLGQTHWCYTHNVVLNGCKDHGHSFQYIALGILRTSATGNVFLSTLRSVNLDGDRNRKSCSVSATPIGCDMICSLVSETEEGDYDSPEPTPMIHGRLGFDGKYREKDINHKNVFRDWRANYPAVGGGSFFGNRVWFAVYGGLREGSSSEKEAAKGYAIYRRYNNTCPDPPEVQERNARAAYRPPRFKNRFIQQGILSLKITSELAVEPSLSLTDNSITLMGAEGRIINVDNRLYLYQRGTSWFPSALLYPLSVTNTTAAVSNPIIFDRFTRPGSDPCSAGSRCPNSCVTGVYTDAYPLAFSKNHSVIAVFGMQLADPKNRLNPQAAVWYGHRMSAPIKVSSSSTKAAYTTSTCFKATKTQKVYCISIVEIGNTLFGEFRIVPLLVEIVSTPAQSARNPSTNLITEPIDPVVESPFCYANDSESFNELLTRYAYSWP